MPIISGNNVVIDAITATEQGSAPTTPPTGKWRLYFKSTGLYLIDDAGIEYGPVSTSSAAQVYPDHAEFWRNFDRYISGSLTMQTDADQMYNMYVNTTYGASGDEWEQEFLIDAGTYTFSSLGYTGTSRGIVEWYIDNVLVATHDWYDGSATNNTIKATSGIVIAAGLHTLRGKVTGKNGSSSAYVVPITVSWLTKE